MELTLMLTLSGSDCRDEAEGNSTQFALLSDGYTPELSARISPAGKRVGGEIRTAD